MSQHDLRGTLHPKSYYQKPVRPTNTRWLLGALALLYLVFVIYGSLVPLDFRPGSIDQALQEFRMIRNLNLGIGSRADWVANILLFIPLAFFWTGFFTIGSRRLGKFLLSVLVLCACIALSVGIEFIQLFFPPRTVSLNDIKAESIGAIIGIIIWLWRGNKIWSWVSGLHLIQGSRSLAENGLWIYLLFLFGYNVLPLDLTISPVEIYHKWQASNLLLIPFSKTEASIEGLYGLVTDVVIWVPVSFLWVVSGKKTRTQAWHWALGAAVVLELLQLFIYSRVSDSTDIVTGFAGAFIGAQLAGQQSRLIPNPEAENNLKLFWAGIAAFFLWCGVLAMIFWYPFEFRTDGAFLRERMANFYKVPFQAYYWGSEFRAVTEVLHKVLFFVPLGVILAYQKTLLKNSYLLNAWGSLSLLAIIGVALTIEVGQAALPEKVSGTTDLALEVIGGVLGYRAVLFAVGRAR